MSEQLKDAVECLDNAAREASEMNANMDEMREIGSNIRLDRDHCCKVGWNYDRLGDAVAKRITADLEEANNNLYEKHLKIMEGTLRADITAFEANMQANMNRFQATMEAKMTSVDATMQASMTTFQATMQADRTSLKNELERAYKDLFDKQHDIMRQEMLSLKNELVSQRKDDIDNTIESFDGEVVKRWNVPSARKEVSRLFGLWQLSDEAKRVGLSGRASHTLVQFIAKFVVFAAFVITYDKQPGPRCTLDEASDTKLQEVVDDILKPIEIPRRQPFENLAERKADKDWVELFGSNVREVHL
jgi:hypothetical protein